MEGWRKAGGRLTGCRQRDKHHRIGRDHFLVWVLKCNRYLCLKFKER